jgi:hypothetical protein
MRNLNLPLVALLLLMGCNPPPIAPPQKGIEKQVEPDLIKLSEAVFKRYWELGYERLNVPQKTFLCIWGLEAEVNNGGFDQYYFNSAGDHAADTPESLRTIGAEHTAMLVKKANDVFGPIGPSRNRNERQKQLHSLAVDQKKELSELTNEFFRYHDNLDEMLKAYVGKNEAAFAVK